ncbi:MAG TPA: cyclase family protein [Anaerolineae bacterium]|nr:cyclase family protein [Anaerolineae bacterium]HNU03338.1 cyclase family protein [Anaerolineae bacterium]
MTIHDISLTITSDLPVWPGDPPVRLSQPLHLERGDTYTLTRLDMGAHTGTHLDAPAHFIRGGATVESLDLETLIGPALVVDARGRGHLSAETLEALAIPAGVQRLLLRTDNSLRWQRDEQTFAEDFIAIAPSGAAWLAARGVKLVGIDYLSVAPFDDSASTHQILLGAGVVAVEGLNLSAIEPGDYQLICLPIKIGGADGAPCRAVLVR